MRLTLSTLLQMTQQAAVAAGDQHTVDAAVRILRSGGNAVDAAVAAGFAAAVVEPCLTSLGGGGFLLHQAPDGSSRVFDFFVDAPGRGLDEESFDRSHFEPITLQFAGTTQTFHCGYGSVAVPGVLSGYLQAHTELGRLPLAEVVAPAIALARDGFRLGATQAGLFTLLHRIITSSPEAAGVFGTYVDSPQRGEAVRNDLYADFLDELADAHSGSPAPWQQRLIGAMREHDGLVTADDLAAYRVVDRAPMRVDLNGATFLTNPPPAFGGVIVGHALHHAYGAGTTESTPGAIALLTALQWATVEGKRGADDPPRSSRGTTQISIIDGDGGTVSMTTSNGSCSGVMIPGTGIQLNNMMGEADLHPHGFHRTRPGTRIASMMAPSIITWPNGSMAAIGSGGSERIRSAIVQVSASLLAGHDVAVAVDAPRMHLDDDSIVQVEPGLPEQLLEQVAEVWPVNQWPDRDLYFGGTHVVRRHSDGSMEAGGDPRRGGAAAVVDL